MELLIFALVIILPLVMLNFIISRLGADSRPKIKSQYERCETTRWI